MQDSTMLGTKRKNKEEGDNESPESLTGNGPRVQRPTPKPSTYSLVNPGKAFEPSSAASSPSLPQIAKGNINLRSSASGFDSSVLNNLTLSRLPPNVYGDEDQQGLFKGPSGLS